MTQTILLIVALITVLLMAISFYWNEKIIKFITITIFIVLANAIYFSLDGVKGWPSEDTRVVKGVLASVVIVNPSSESEGAIYISLYPSTPPKWHEYVYPRYAPKTFYVKYSNDRAAIFEKAKQAMEEGQEVRINGIPPENSGGGESVSDANVQETLSGIIGQFIDKMIPKQGDTYKPEVPDVEIMEQQIPPDKGSNQ